MFRLIGAAVSGLVVGALARLFYPAVVDMGWIMTSLLGIGGSLVAGFIADRGARDPRPAGCLASVLGAMLLIWLGRHFGLHW